MVVRLCAIASARLLFFPCLEIKLIQGGVSDLEKLHSNETGVTDHKCSLMFLLEQHSGIPLMRERQLSANDTAAVALNTACQTKQGVTNNTENVKYLFNGFYF